MANVLPLKDRQTSRRNYWLRLFITFSFVITAAVTIGLVALIPSYILARAQHMVITKYSEIQSDTGNADKNNIAVQTSRMVNVQMDELRKANDTNAAQVISLVVGDWEIYKDSIIINSFAYDFSGEGEKIIQKLRVSGEAKNRSSLNSFVQTLRANPAFLEVSFPVSDLVGGEILDFSLTVQLKS